MEKSRQKIIEIEQEKSWIDWVSQHHEKLLEWDSFSREELWDALNKFVGRILVRFDKGKNDYIITIKFKLPLLMMQSNTTTQITMVRVTRSKLERIN